MRFIGWRWTPSVALVCGSLAFVAVAVAIVPDDLGAVGSGADRLKRATRSRLSTNAASTNDAVSDSNGDEESASGARERRRSAAHSEGAPADPGNVVQSIFHSAPKIELPIAPVDPEPQPPPPPPPPPPPTATVYTLQNPLSPNVVPEPPSQPQGVQRLAE